MPNIANAAAHTLVPFIIAAALLVFIFWVALRRLRYARQDNDYNADARSAWSEANVIYNSLPKATRTRWQRVSGSEKYDMVARKLRQLRKEDKLRPDMSDAYFDTMLLPALIAQAVDPLYLPQSMKAYGREVDGEQIFFDPPEHLQFKNAWRYLFRIPKQYR